MGRLVNQHQLAAKLGRSRSSIIAWARAGMPVAQRGGPGRPTKYDLEQVLAWIARTGKGVRPELAPMPLGPDVCTPPQIPQAELLLGRVLEEGLGGIVATLIAAGVPGEAALAGFDALLVAAYRVLEQYTGRLDSAIPMDGPLALLMDDGGRARIIEHAKRVAAEVGSVFAAEPAMVQ